MSIAFQNRAVGPGAATGRRGLTLIELSVSLVIMVIVLGAITSAVVIASHAIPDGTGPLEAGVRGSEAANQIARELGYAISFVERSSNAVEFTVADRDADLANDTIRYAWSGTSGDPVTRQYNGGDVVDFVDDVSEFVLAYDLKSITEQQPGPDKEGSEVLLSSYTESSDLGDFSIDQDNWIGQYFNPSAPADATGWNVTRVLFEAKYRGATDGQTLVQLRPADADTLPTDTVLEQVTMYESELQSSYTWREFPFSNVTGRNPGDGLCLVLQFVTADHHSANIRYANKAGAGRRSTSNAGGSWTYDSGMAMRYYVYGTWTAPGSWVDVTREFVTGVRLTLRVGDSAQARIHTGVQVFNTPEVSTP